MRVSLVITVLNEESTIDWLLAAITDQLRLPEEIVIVDGGSTDSTASKIRQWQKNKKIGKKIKLFQKKGNRAVGRNWGIQKASYSWIAITDAGCLPFPLWLASLVAKQQETNAQVITGYAMGIPTTRFEEAVIPYVMVMPDKVEPKKYLPATRSILLAKSVWKQLVGFDESLNHNEDYAFAKKIERAGVLRSFEPNALVGWLPRKNWGEFWEMIFRFALGDIQAHIIRPKVVLVFTRYILFIALFVWIAATNQLAITNHFFPIMIFVYLWWAIRKNRKYVPRGWLWLPVLQITADVAVMAGSITGAMWLVKKATAAILTR